MLLCNTVCFSAEPSSKLPCLFILWIHRNWLDRNCLLHIHTETESGFRFETETKVQHVITQSSSKWSCCEIIVALILVQQVQKMYKHNFFCLVITLPVDCTILIIFKNKHPLLKIKILYCVIKYINSYRIHFPMSSKHTVIYSCTFRSR